MKNELQIFKNEELEMEIRTLIIEGEPYFVGKDVAEILGYSNSSKAVSTHVDDEDKILEMIAHSQNGNMVKTQTALINESGLYSLILSSKLPSAKKFKRWVTSEVLPQIRKTGGYIPVDEGMTDSEIMARALLIAQGTINKKDELIRQHEKTIEQQKPLVDFANTIASTSKSIDMSSFAKLIKDEGIKMGRNKLFEWLRNNGYLMKNKNNEPYQRYIDSKIFEVVEYTITINGKSEPKIKTLVTGKGQIYLIKKLKEQNKINN